MRQQLAEIYQKLLKEHEAYVKANFRMLSYGMKVDSETYKKSYPDSFVRYFFRFVKSIGAKRGNKLNLAQVKRRIKSIPPAFIISAGIKRC
jgi:hypothetical protein